MKVYFILFFHCSLSSASISLRPYFFQAFPHVISPSLFGSPLLFLPSGYNEVLYPDYILVSVYNILIFASSRARSNTSGDSDSGGSGTFLKYQLKEI